MKNYKQERDTAKYWNHMNVRIALWGLENESQPEKDLPLRVIGYDGAAYRNQLAYTTDNAGKRVLNDDPRYPVVTLVLYFGYKKRWDRPLNLLQCLNAKIPDKLRPLINDYRINLFEIAYLPDEQVAKFKSDFRYYFTVAIVFFTISISFSI